MKTKYGDYFTFSKDGCQASCPKTRNKVAKGLSYINPLYVAYRLVQVNLKTEDKSCGTP
jgi:hypothetical protein